MKRPAIFFDRDNTIIVSDGYLGDPEKVVLMDGAADAIARARSLGFATVIISNQSGVARGMFSEDDVHAVNRKVDQMLLAANGSAVIDRHEFCPYHPDGTVDQYKQESDLRKPRPGMILSAAEAMALDLERSWMIGDAPRDIEAGRSAGCRTILLQPKGVSPSPAAGEQSTAPPNQTVSTLKEAMDFVESNLSAGTNIPAPASTQSSTEEEEMQESAQVTSGSTARITSPPAPPRLEQLAEQILEELRKRNQQEHYSDFSVSKLMAGIVQVITIALLFLAYLNRAQETSYTFQQLILFAIFFQVLTVALLIMGRDK